jgi:hypothetical protein
MSQKQQQQQAVSSPNVKMVFNVNETCEINEYYKMEVKKITANYQAQLNEINNYWIAYVNQLLQVGLEWFNIKNTPYYLAIHNYLAILSEIFII